MNKSFYSGEKIIYDEEEHKVFYKGNTDHGVSLPVHAGSSSEKPGYASFICEDFIAAVTAHACTREGGYPEPGTEIHKLLRLLLFKKPRHAGRCCYPQKAVRQSERPETSYGRTEVI